MVLGRMEKVELREIWPNEAQDFTPWLEENISALGSALGMDLEADSIEAPVGGYSLDVLARESRSERYVVIENQLGVTDHDHLGKLITYAAHYDAKVMVWIAREFRDEHRAALDLLNRRTGEDSQFFGVEVELWKIDTSRPAVNFNLVVTPNEWSKRTGGAARPDGGVSEKGERYRVFWQSLVDTMRDEHKFTNRKRGTDDPWSYFSSGHRGVGYQAVLGSHNSRLEVHIDKGDYDSNKGLFEQLAEHKDAIESELNETLQWERSDQHRRSRICLTRQGGIDDEEETLREIQGWLVDRLPKFKQV